MSELAENESWVPNAALSASSLLGCGGSRCCWSMRGSTLGASSWSWQVSGSACPHGVERAAVGGRRGAGKRCGGVF